MLYKRKNSSNWWTKLKVKGIEPYPFRQSTGTSDKEQAEEYEALLKAELYKQARLGVRKRYTWNEAVNEWLAHTEKRSIERDEQIIEWSFPYCDGKFLDELNVAFFMQLRKKRLNEDPHKRFNWIQKRKGKITSKNTVNRYLAFHRTLLNQCVDWEMLDKAPKMPMYDLPERKEPRWITRSKFEELFLKLPPLSADIARFGVSTGLRMRNMTYLRPDQVNIFARNLKVYRTSAKGKKTILTPLNDEACKILKHHINKEFPLAEMPRPDRVFIQGVKKLRQIDSINTKAWAKACNEAEIPGFRVHDLRHSWATWHVLNGTPLPVLQRLGGWASLESVEIYAHFADEYLKLYAGNTEKINEEFSGTGFQGVEKI